MMWWHWGGLGWGMGWGFLWMVLVWGAIIALIVWGIRRFTGHNMYRMDTHSALDIAKERYARGEISRDQFEQIKNDLQQK